IIEQGKALTTSEARREAMEIAARLGGESGFINLKDIKVRIRDYEDFLHPDGTGSFIHITIRMLAGRTSEMKEGLSTALRDAFVRRFDKVASISIEICDMDPASYKKRVLAPDQK